VTPWRGRARVTESPAGQRLRAVLDTNVVLSALLFDSGRLSPLRHHWQSGRIVLLVSKATAQELLRVLAYPKFRLTAAERDELLANYLPYAEAVTAPESSTELPQCRDPKDQMFLLLAHAGNAEIARWEGGLFLGYYVAYVAYLVLAAQRHDGVQAFGDAMLGFVVPLTIVTLGVTMLRRAGR